LGSLPLVAKRPIESMWNTIDPQQNGSRKRKQALHEL
jgi:hypothetical protein